MRKPGVSWTESAGIDRGDASIMQKAMQEGPAVILMQPYLIVTPTAFLGSVPPGKPRDRQNVHSLLRTQYPSALDA